MVHRSGKGLEISEVIMAANGFDVCALRQVDKAAGAITFDLNTKHPVQLSKVSDLEVLAEADPEFNNKAGVIHNDHAIIHMHHHNGEFALADDDLEINGLVHTTLYELEGLEDTGELLVPMVTRLLEPIKGLDKVQDMCASIEGLVARGMLHVEDLIVLELAVKICTLDVYLVHLEAEVVGHCDDGACGHKLGHQLICVIIVDTADLAEALGDKVGLVANDVAYYTQTLHRCNHRYLSDYWP